MMKRKALSFTESNRGLLFSKSSNSEFLYHLKLPKLVKQKQKPPKFVDGQRDLERGLDLQQRMIFLTSLRMERNAEREARNSVG